MTMRITSSFGSGNRLTHEMSNTNLSNILIDADASLLHVHRNVLMHMKPGKEINLSDKHVTYRAVSITIACSRLYQKITTSIILAALFATISING